MERINVTTAIDSSIKAIALEMGLTYRECLEFGILFKVAETHDMGYPANLLSLKLEKVVARLNEAMARLEGVGEGESEIVAAKNFPGEHYGN